MYKRANLIAYVVILGIAVYVTGAGSLFTAFTPVLKNAGAMQRLQSPAEKAGQAEESPRDQAAVGEPKSNPFVE
ncbi:MAG: hypothetical protein AB8B91_11025 [Rubripirellula sp.]